LWGEKRKTTNQEKDFAASTKKKKIARGTLNNEPEDIVCDLTGNGEKTDNGGYTHTICTPPNIAKFVVKVPRPPSLTCMPG